MLDVTVRAFRFPGHPEWNVPDNLPELLQSQIQAVRWLWPVVRLVGSVQPELRTLFGGFVWQEDGQIVGIANVVRPTRSPHYEIGNVGVLPAYRGRRIGPALVEACLDYVRDRQGELAFLKVIEGNRPAIAMYERLGFEIYDSSWEMGFYETATDPGQLPSLPHGMRWQPFGFGQGHPCLAQRVISATSQAIEPQSPRKFRAHWLLRLLAPIYRHLCGVRFRGMAIVTEEEQTLGSVEMLIQPGANTATMLVDSANEGVAEAMLRLVRGYCPLALSIRQKWLIDLAMETGFALDFRYLRMGLRL